MKRKCVRESWQNYLPKCCVVSKDDCWLWQKAKLWGYGIVRYQGHNIGAHRLSFMLSHPGIDIAGLQVNHHCDNRACINPEHLYAGTQEENVRDMVTRGRQNHDSYRGENNVFAKLKEADVRAIRKRLLLGETSYAIAKDYPVDSKVIRRIGRREKWAHIE